MDLCVNLLIKGVPFLPVRVPDATYQRHHPQTCYSQHRSNNSFTRSPLDGTRHLADYHMPAQDMVENHLEYLIHSLISFSKDPVT